jgi:hypothetical protein
MSIAVPYPPVVVGCAVQIRAYCTFAGQLSINTFYYRVSGVAGAAAWSPKDLADAFATSVGVGALYDPLINNNATYYGLQAKFLEQPWVAGPPVKPEGWSNPGNSVVGAGVGSGGANAIPLQDCGLISFATATAGKQGRGRVYIPFPASNQLTAGTGLFAAGYVANLEALAVGMGVGTGTSFTIVNITDATAMQLKHHLHRYGGPNYYQSISRVSHIGVATQRRRGNTFGRTNQLPF